MPLEILALMVVAGLTLVIGAVHLSGGSKPAEPMSEVDAVNRFRIDFPGFETSEVFLANDGKVAFLTSHGSQSIGMVEQMGRHRLTRLLDQKSVRAVSAKGANIAIQLSDSTLPWFDLEMTDTANREKVLGKLGELRGG